MKENRVHQSQDFKDKIVQETQETGNATAVAEKYKIDRTLIYSWVKAAKNKENNKNKKSIRDLERELADSQLENKILKELLKKTTQTLIKD